MTPKRKAAAKAILQIQRNTEKRSIKRNKFLGRCNHEGTE